MPISYDQFRLLPFAQQLPLIWVSGTYLARRWEEEDAVGLYHLAGGFFAEVYYYGKDHNILNVDSFTSSAVFYLILSCLGWRGCAAASRQPARRVYLTYLID